MIVLDASVVVELLLRRKETPALLSRLSRRRERIHAPHLIDPEVLHTLRRLYLRGDLPRERAEEALLRYRQMRIQRYPHLVLLDRVWELRDVLTAYDACYVALAEFLNTPLLTFDTALAQSTGHDARIELAG